MSTSEDEAHIYTLPLPAVSGNTPQTQPLLSPADRLLLINKVQAGELPSITIIPHTNVNMSLAEAARFSLESDPGALPYCLIQMALNWVFNPMQPSHNDNACVPGLIRNVMSS